MTPHGMIAEKTLPDGRFAGILPLTFDRARIVAGPNWTYYEDGW